MERASFNVTYFLRITISICSSNSTGSVSTHKDRGLWKLQTHGVYEVFTERVNVLPHGRKTTYSVKLESPNFVNEGTLDRRVPKSTHAMNAIRKKRYLFSLSSSKIGVLFIHVYVDSNLMRSSKISECRETRKLEISEFWMSVSLNFRSTEFENFGTSEFRNAGYSDALEILDYRSFIFLEFRNLRILECQNCRISEITESRIFNNSEFR